MSKMGKLFLLMVVGLLLIGLMMLAAGNLHVGGITPLNTEGTPLVPVSTYCGGGSCIGQPMKDCSDWKTITIWPLGPVSVSLEKSKDCEGYAFVATARDAGPYTVEMADGDISDSLAITAPGSQSLHDIVGPGSGEIEVIDANGNVWTEHFTLK